MKRITSKLDVHVLTVLYVVWGGDTKGYVIPKKAALGNMQYADTYNFKNNAYLHINRPPTKKF